MGGLDILHIIFWTIRTVNISLSIDKLPAYPGHSTLVSRWGSSMHSGLNKPKAINGDVQISFRADNTVVSAGPMDGTEPDFGEELETERTGDWVASCLIALTGSGVMNSRV